MTELRGRTAECAAVRELVDGVRGGAGRVLVLRGDPGAGKSALLDHAAELAAGPGEPGGGPGAADTGAAGAAGPGRTDGRAADDGAERSTRAAATGGQGRRTAPGPVSAPDARPGGALGAGPADGPGGRGRGGGGAVRVLRASGVEAESGLAFSALHQLLRPVAHLADALPAGQRDAVRGALGLAEARTDDRFLVSAGVLSLLTEAAADSGVLCLVDDVQWCDRASTDALLFTARRLSGEGVGLLVAVRDTPDARHLLRGLPDLAVPRLDTAAAAAVLADRAAVPPDPRVAARVAELTGGNPLAVGEAADLLTADQLTGAAPLPDPLPGGTAADDLFGAAVARLPDPTRRALLAAALGGGAPGPVRDAARRLGAGPDALDAAEAAGLVATDGAALRFRHPLVRSAVSTAAGPVLRRRAHTALADAFDAAGDPDRAARHRAAAATAPDAGTATALAAAAARDRDRGGFADAADAFARAADLTPDPEERARRSAEAARTAWLGGRPGLARGRLAAARADARDPGLRADLDRLHGRFEVHSGDAAEALRVFGAAAERAAEGGDPERALALLADAAEAASHVGDLAATVDLGRRAAGLPAPADPSTAYLREVLAGIGELRGGAPERGADRVRRALAALPDGAGAAELLWAGTAASHLGEADAAAVYVERAGQIARMSGMSGTLPAVLELVATGERMNGRLSLSAAVAEEGLELAREAGYVNSAAAHLANLAMVDALRGREDACRERAHAALATAIPHRVGLRASIASYALALLDLGLGRFAPAHERLTAIAAAGPGAGHPITVWGSTADRVEAAVAAGDHGAARAAAAFLDGWSAGAATPRARAMRARCHGLVAEDDAAAADRYAEALDLLAGDGGAEVDRARTGLLLGERLRRARRAAEARPHLRAAAEAFGRLGMAPWERRAAAELRAAGEAPERAAPAALDALTPQELRIARLVAEGASNREVAARLFLSPRTVEYHLYKAYPKLGVATRTELARMVSAAGTGAEPAPRAP
jgi:DNA-binding NarL/FixJ family response regulator